MAPPDPWTSVFDVEGGVIRACDEPVDLAHAFTLAVQAHDRLLLDAQALEHEIDAMKARFDDAALICSYESEQHEALKKELTAKGSTTAAQTRLRDIRKGSPPARPTEVKELAELIETLKNLRQEATRTAATVKELQAEMEALEAQIAIDEAQLAELKQELPRLQKRLEALAPLATLRRGGSTSMTINVSPTGLNTDAKAPRYFRVLFWNLENFTRDPRPRGSAPIDSHRNQARVAVVAHLAQRLGADALLVMETGRDVGTAMTHVARRLKDVEMPPAKDERDCEPLVSPATHLIPEVKADYPELKLGRPTGERALALRVLSSAFSIAPHASVPATKVTEQQLKDACKVLAQSSSAVKTLKWLPHDASLGWVEDGSTTLPTGNPAPGLGWLLHLFGELLAYGHELQAIYWYLHALIDWLQMGAREPLHVDWAVGIVHACREFAELGARGLAPIQLVGLVELTELAILFMLKANGQMDLGPAQRGIWVCSSAEDASLALLAFYCTGAQHVAMEAHDRDIGPLASAYDPELLLHALWRIGAVQYNLETYGIVYRPWHRDLLEGFFNAPGLQLGFDGAGTYGILKKDTQGQFLRLQTQGDVLSGRSAMLVSFPVGFGRWISLALHHNRFTATAEIKKMGADALADNKYTGEDNVLRARSLSLIEVVKACAGLPGPPLVVGDFNLPGTLLEDEPEPDKGGRSWAPWQRRSLMRRELQDGTLLRGYLRRSAGGAHPRTSLAAHGSIATGANVTSQPYDAVYQPFDLLDGAAAVRSGVVEKLEGLLPLDLLAMAIDAAPLRFEEDEDVELSEEEDKGAEDRAPVTTDTMDAMDEDKTESMPVWYAIAFEIRRVYRSLHRQATKAIREGGDWFRREINAQLEKTPYDASRVEALTQLNDTDALEKLVRERANQLYLQLKNNPEWVFVDTQHPLDAWIATAKQALVDSQVAPPKALKALPDTLQRIGEQLKGLEKDPERRLWVGYRAAVSDHLPVIVEIDLQPYS